MPDFTSQKPFNKLFKNTKQSALPLTYIIHTASPLKFNIKNIQKKMIEPTIIRLA
jgi:hypothetical protein